MTSKKQLLNDLLDIGGVATLNNLYQPTATTYKGAMKRVRVNKDFWLSEGLIEVVKPYYSYRSEFPARELFYCLTKKGAAFIGRDDYDYKKASRSPHLENIMHESAKFDVALAFVRLYRDWDVKIEYKTFKGLRPDIFITMKKNGVVRYFLVEIERKKDISRVIREKIKEQYKNKLKIKETKEDLPRIFNLLIVYSPLTYNPFTRPQEMTGNIVKDIEDMRSEAYDLARYGELDIVLCIPLPDFYRLNEAVWFNSLGGKIKLIQ